MPLDPHVLLEPNPEGNEGNRSNSYAWTLGKLQYLTNATRPDIAFVVNRLTLYMANPSLQHTGALKRVLQYLAGTKTCRITYSASPSRNKNTNLFEGYADATYGNAGDSKSTSGYIFTVGGGAITWLARNVIVLSSMEAEYVTLSEVGCKASWLRELYKELGYEQLTSTTICGDNEGAIAMTRNPQFHKKSKHITHKWHWVREAVENRVINIESCRDPDQTADVLTKALACPKHKKHIAEMGLAPT
jgi:hypothetical protein